MSACLTTHVLDTALGRARGRRAGPARRATPTAAVVGDRRAPTPTAGVGELGAGRAAEPGTYRLRFDTAAYFAATGQAGFFPEVAVTVRDHRPDAALPRAAAAVSPFAYSTYRGS